jgi:porin
MTLPKRLAFAFGLTAFFMLGEWLFAGPENAVTVASPQPAAPATPTLQADTSSWSNGPYLTGDWGGERTELENEGVDPYVDYTSIVIGSPSGGIHQSGPKYAQDINFGLTFDMQKLVDWEGATINVNSVDRIGKTIRPDVGSLYDPVQIYGGQTITLYNVTLEQKFWNDSGAIKVGRLSPGDDFAESPLYNYYVNNGIDGQIRAVIHDTRFSTYPFATWGGRLRFDPTPEYNIQTGVFEVSDQLFSPARRGLNFTVNGSDGILAVQQFGWTPEFDKQPVEASAVRSTDAKAVSSAPVMQGLPGHYFIGGYWSNSDYPQFGTPVKTRISYGFYGHADQMVYREAPGSDLGLTVFGTIAYAPQQNISLIPFQLSGGALYQGLVPDRPKDMTIFGVIYGDLSNDYATSVEPDFGARPTTEVDLEFGYRLQATDFAYIQPDVQYIVRPGGSGNIPDAVIVGAQIGLTF